MLKKQDAFTPSGVGAPDLWPVFGGPPLERISSARRRRFPRRSRRLRRAEGYNLALTVKSIH